MNPDDDVALALARRILDSTARWRPLPDLAIVITDDVEAAVDWAEARDGVAYTAEPWHLHHRASSRSRSPAESGLNRTRGHTARAHSAADPTLT